MLTPLLRDRAMMVCQRHFDNHRRSAARNDAAPLRYGANICRSWGDGRTDVGQRHAEAGSVPPTVVWEQGGICGCTSRCPRAWARSTELAAAWSCRIRQPCGSSRPAETLPDPSTSAPTGHLGAGPLANVAIAQNHRSDDWSAITVADSVETLILDLLDWIGSDSRPYTEVMDAWRTSCPRLPVWEEANERGFVSRQHQGTLGTFVAVTPLGMAYLSKHRPQTLTRREV